MNLVEVYFDKKSLHLVVPLYEGGEVFKQVELCGGLSEDKAARSVYQLAYALNYLHKKKICHRDLKLENLVHERRNYSSNSSSVRLIDFGLSTD